MNSGHKILVGLLVMNGLALNALAFQVSAHKTKPKGLVQITPKATKYLNGFGIFRPFSYFEDTQQEEPVYASTEVSEKPEFYGGSVALEQYVSDHLKYPEAALKEEKEGRIWVEAIIEKEGTIKEVRIARGMGLGCDEEALRIVRSMPRWKPGKLQNSAVRVKVNIPVLFKLP
jgi:TonB family protein